MAYFDLHIFICTNRRPDAHPLGSCAASDSEAVHAYLKARVKALELPARIRVNKAGCLDRCAKGPVLVIYPEGTWYRCPDHESAELILQEHIVNKNLVQSLHINDVA